MAADDKLFKGLHAALDSAALFRERRMKINKTRVRIATSLLLSVGCMAIAAANDEADHSAPGHADDAHLGMHSDHIAVSDALWFAAAEGDFDRFRRLLAQGADLHAMEEGTHTTALWIAAQQGHSEIVAYLLAHGAAVDLDEEVPDGRTALFQAAQEGHTEIVALLLDAGADVEARTESTGATPLFIASARGHTEIVRLLLDAGADVHAMAGTDDRADTPLSIARERGHAGVVALLEGAIATTGAVVP
jgi:ankyrin repeat protein